MQLEGEKKTKKKKTKSELCGIQGYKILMIDF